MLCAYWYQLAVFYPLARNNYKVASGANEPFNIKDTATALPMVKTAMQDRLKMLRYLYTTAFEASLNGGTFARPMYFEYPEDKDAWFNLDQDFMVGSHVKVSPVLAAGLTEYDSYFPARAGEAWVNVFDLKEMQVAGDPKMNSRTMIKPSAHINAYLRPGSIIPMQDLSYMSEDGKTKLMSMTTEDLMRKNALQLVINPDKDSRAMGTVLIDDGYSKDMLDAKMYDYYGFTMTDGVIRKQWKTNESGAGGYPDAKKGDPVQMNKLLEKITLVNVADKKYTFACWTDAKMRINPLTIHQDDTTKAWTFSAATDMHFYSIQNIYFGEKGDQNPCALNAKEWEVLNPSSLDLSGSSATFEIFNPNANGPTITVQIDALIEADFRVQMRVTDPSWDPYVPENLKQTQYTPNTEVILSDHMDIVSAAGKAFSMKIYSSKEKTDPILGKVKVPIWDSADHDLHLEKMLMIWGTNLMTQKKPNFSGVFGLGERVDDKFFLRDGTFSFWNRGEDNIVEDGSLPGKNNYGTHPYFAYRTQTDTFVSNFFNNAAANDILIENNADTGVVSLDYISIGGSFDLFIEEEFGVDALIKRYHHIVGTPLLVP